MYDTHRKGACFFMKKNESKKPTQEAKKGGGTPNQGTLQSYIQNFTKQAIDKIVYIMRHSKNESLKFGAMKVIIDKSIADLHEAKVDANITTLNINRDYISPRGWVVPASIRSLEGSDTVQSSGVAQES